MFITDLEQPKAGNNPNVHSMKYYSDMEKKKQQILDRCYIDESQNNYTAWNKPDNINYSLLYNFVLKGTIRKPTGINVSSQCCIYQGKVQSENEEF